MLHTYLQKIGLTTGPLERNTSHSGLESLRKYLLGHPQFQGDESFLKFGVALHDVFLQDDFTVYKTLANWEQEKVDRMVEALRADPVVMRLMENSVREKKLYKKLHGVMMAYILDIKKPKERIGADLKTTVCTNYHDCVKKSIEYGYVKQARVYMKMENLKEFYFIFICKTAPHKIFIVSYKELRDFEEASDNEIEFLLYFYKKYGKFMTEQDKLNLPTNMAQTGKDAMNKISEALKLHENIKKTADVAAKQVVKSKKEIVGMISKFPKKEAPLYQEKLDKVTNKL